MREPKLTLSELKVRSFLAGADKIRAGYEFVAKSDDCDPNSGVIIISPTGP